MIDLSIVAGCGIFLAAFILGARQDLRTRKVRDYVWAPAIIGLMITYTSPITWVGIPFFLFRATIALGMGLWLSRKKLWGSADTIGFTLVFALPSLVAPLFLAGAPILVVIRDGIRSRMKFDFSRKDYPLVAFMAFGMACWLIALGVLNLAWPWFPML